MNIALNLNHVSLRIDKHLILNRINLQVNEGQCYGILGPNGSGKTSLLRCMYGSLLPSSGSVELFGKSINDYSRHERSKIMAVVLQEMNPDLALSVVDILKLGRLPYQTLFSSRGYASDGRELDDNEFDRYEQKLIQELDLQSLLQRVYKRLSGGEKQRVMLARALFQKPKVLFLDEPTNHLDISHQLSIIRYVSDLDITVICSLHDLNLASRYCDQVAIINDGELIDHGAPQSVLAEGLIKQVYAVKSYRFNNPNTGKSSLDFY